MEQLRPELPRERLQRTGTAATITAATTATAAATATTTVAGTAAAGTATTTVAGTAAAGTAAAGTAAATTAAATTAAATTAATTTLADEDLLLMLLDPGPRVQSASRLAAELVRQCGGLAGLSRSTVRELSQIRGLGTRRAARVCAAFELGRRAVAAAQRRTTIAHADDVYRIVAPRVSGLQQEVFFVLGIDVRNGLLDCVEVARGSVSDVSVHPREVFRPLVRMAAAGAVLAHNHPTGDATPSDDDIALTQRLREVGMLLGIPVIDHVVVGDGAFRSIAEWVGTAL